MLRLAEVDEYATREAVSAASPERPAPASPSFERGGRYGERRRFSPATVAGVIAAHVGAFLLGMYLQPHVHRADEHRLKVVDVRLAPPPPPPEHKPQDQPEAVRLKTRPVPAPPAAPVAVPVAVSLAARPAPVFLAPPQPPAPPSSPAPPAPPAVIESGDIGARMVSARPPRYPIDARRKREQGTVLLAVTLAPDGHVASVSIARSSGFASLDDAARDAVRHWLWAPTLRDGEPVMVRGVVEIPFVLQG
jgi:periplasmic protein TonB